MGVFSPIRKQRASSQVIESIRAAVVEGRISAGSTLGSERELADQFAVNRSTIREAMTALAELGLVEIRHGGATRVRDFRTHGSPSLLRWLIFRGRRVDANALVDLLELRAVVLRYVARRAAARGTSEQCRALTALAEQLARPDLDVESRQRLDLDFVEALVVAANNDVVRVFLGPIRRLYLGRAEFFRPLFASSRFSSDPYDEIARAVAIGAVEEADAAMERYAERAFSVVPTSKENVR